jgi:acetyltransferase-like isoleucine patch superfamily enzyme
VAVQRFSVAFERRLARLKSLWWQRRLGSVGQHLFIENDVQLENPDRMHFGDSVVIKRYSLLSCHPGGTLRIEDRVQVGRGCIIACGDSELRIGHHTAMGAYISVRNAEHGMVAGSFVPDQPMSAKPLSIGAGVYIGDRCSILGGVTIGDGAVVAANSVVIIDVPDNSVVAGAPARVVKVRR